MSKITRRYVYTVGGRGDFPLDMLRYDQCWPIDSHSAANIAPQRENREVKLCGLLRPTSARWQSFLWYVKPEIEEHTS